MNRNVVGSIYGRPSIKIANFGSVNKHGQHRQFVLLIGRFINNFLLWNRLVKWTETWLEASIEGPLCRLLISSRSVHKHGHHRQFLLLIGWFLKKSFPLKPSSQMNRNLVGSNYGRFCIKFPKNRMKGERHRLSPLSV